MTKKLIAFLVLLSSIISITKVYAEPTSINIYLTTSEFLFAEKFYNGENKGLVCCERQEKTLIASNIKMSDIRLHTGGHCYVIEYDFPHNYGCDTQRLYIYLQPKGGSTFLMIDKRLKKSKPLCFKLLCCKKYRKKNIKQESLDSFKISDLPFNVLDININVDSCV